MKPREIDFLEEIRDRLTVVQGDITRTEDLLNAVSEYDVEDIVRTAAIPRKPICREKPAQTFTLMWKAR